MDVDDAAGERLYDIGRHFQETGQYDQVNITFLQQLYVVIAPEELFLVYQHCGYLFSFRYFKDAGFRFVGHDQ